jgi:hypothetical protein
MFAALAKLLRPVARLLLKNSFPYSAFEAVAKRVFVESAMSDHAVPGRKPSASRAAVITGLTRKEVNVLMADPSDTADYAGHSFNRAARVVTAWMREAAFLDASGNPRPLYSDSTTAPEGEKTFADLVRLHGGDVPARAVFDELERVGSIEEMPDGRIALVSRAYVPKAESLVPIVNLLGTGTRDLMDTIVHNIEHGEHDPRFQRRVMHVGIPVEVLPAFRAMSTELSQRALEEMDAWLAAHDILQLPKDKQTSCVTARVGVGIHYFQELESPEQTSQYLK